MVLPISGGRRIPAASAAMPHNGLFQGKTVVVTGGASGMGRAAAVEFARQGAAVAIADVNAAAGRDALAEVRRAGGRGRGLLVVADVSRASACQRVVRRTLARFGGIDVLFNNVG